MADAIEAPHADDFKPEAGARLCFRELKRHAGSTPKKASANGRLKGGREFGAFGPAIKHNLRHLIPGQPLPRDADASMTHLNEVLAGATGASPVADAARIAGAAMPKGRGKPTRTDATWGVEYVFSAPADFDRADEFLRASVAWLIDRKKATVVSAVIHRDQGNPHAHVILWPVVEEQWVGSRLLDGWAELHQQYAAEVCASFGLRHAMREAKVDSAAAARMVLDGPMRDSPARECPSWPEMEAAIRLDPLPWLRRWGLVAPLKKPAKRSAQKPAKTFVQIMTSTGKRTSEDAQRKREAKPPRQAAPAVHATPMQLSNSNAVDGCNSIGVKVSATPNTGLGVDPQTHGQEPIASTPACNLTPAQLAWRNRKARKLLRRTEREQFTKSTHKPPEARQ